MQDTRHVGASACPALRIAAKWTATGPGQAAYWRATGGGEEKRDAGGGFISGGRSFLWLGIRVSDDNEQSKIGSNSSWLNV
jgi:hypothetical protein